MRAARVPGGTRTPHEPYRPPQGPLHRGRSHPRGRAPVTASPLGEGSLCFSPKRRFAKNAAFDAGSAAGSLWAAPRDGGAVEAAALAVLHDQPIGADTLAREGPAAARL